MTGIDKYAYKSRLARVKAGSKLIFAGIMMALCLLFSSDVISVITIVIMSAATLFMGGYRLKKYLELLLIPLTFLLTGVATIIVNQLAAGSTALISFRLFGGVYGITDDSVKMGVTTLLKAFGAVACLYFFSLNTPMNSFLSLLRKKTPGVIVELMELMYRFIFVVWEEAGKIRMAQASRLGYRGFKNSMSSLGELVTTVFIRAFRRVDRVSVALESRGFEGNFNFLVEAEQPSRQLTGFTILAAGGITVIGLLERLL